MYIYDGKRDIQAQPSKRTASLVSTGTCTCRRNDIMTVRKNGRLDWSLFYCERGKLHIGNTVLPMGAVWIYPPGIPQHYSIYVRDRTKYRYLHFNGHCIEELLAELNIPLQAPILCNKEQLLSLFDKLAEDALSASPHARLCAEYHILQLLSHLAPKPEQSRATGLMRRIIDEMEHTFHTAYDAKKYADMLHVSISRFHHLFKEAVGISPHAYYQKLRMENACGLLESSRLKIGDIAKSCGFEDALYFTQAFKKHTGMTPSSYRKSQKND